jgi:hypothetical protein
MDPAALFGTRISRRLVVLCGALLLRPLPTVAQDGPT